MEEFEYPRLEIRKEEYGDDGRIYYTLCDMTNRYILDTWKIKSQQDIDEFKDDLKMIGFKIPERR